MCYEADRYRRAYHESRGVGVCESCGGDSDRLYSSASSEQALFSEPVEMLRRGIETPSKLMVQPIVLSWALRDSPDNGHVW